MSTTAPEPTRDVGVDFPDVGPPGREVVGPSTSDLVIATRQAIRAELALVAQARMESRRRFFEFSKQAQSDGSGDLAIELFQVPGGSTGHLTRCTVDMAGVTPAAPVTSANLWLAIYAAASAGITNPAQIIAVGAMLACSPNTPAVDAQIPCVLVDAQDSDAAPTLVGPATFYLVVDATTAARQVAARCLVVTETPEP